MSTPLTDNALQVLRARYLARENGVVVETPEQLFRRVARHVSAVESALGYGADEVEAARAKFERMMVSLEFVPNSPTLMNAGRPLGQLAACFVVPVEDSTTGVFEAVRWAAEIQKTGGGTGFSFSRLRPAGDLVASTGGNASGPVSLMQVFDVATEAIKQGGTRRGANMGMLRVDHPDILEFIALKLDPTRMRNFNLSVAATDAFMRAVAAGTTYDLVNPRTTVVTGQLDARRVFDAIANAAWACGDPGLVFIDRINDLHPTPALGPIEATNPCVTGETLVWTYDRGPVAIRTLCDLGVGSQPRVATLDGDELVFRTATQVVCTGERQVYRLRTADGHSLRLTADHRVATERGDIAAQDLEVGMRIRAIYDHRLGDGQALGAADDRLGDGQALGAADDRLGDAPAIRAADRLGEAPAMYGAADRTGSQAVRAVADHRLSDGQALGAADDRLGDAPAIRAADRLGDAPAMCGAADRTGSQAVRAVADHRRSDGSALPATADRLGDAPAIRAAADRTGSQAVRAAADQRLGDVPAMCGAADRTGSQAVRAVADHRLSDGSALRAADRRIAGRASSVGVDHAATTRDMSRGPSGARLFDVPRDRLGDLVGWTAVEALEPDGRELVYDLTEPTTSHFLANGVLVHNCGEQPLLPFESCTLGSIDVGRFVANGDLDWERLRESIQDAVRFLDDVIDANRYPLLQIERATKETRKIGLGIMGWADALVALDIPYDSDAAIELGDRVADFLETESLAASVELAKRRGSFPAWEGSRWQREGQAPLRNATTTTIAPTGTISIIAGCSSGIEPLYALAYRRNVLDGAELTEVNPMFQRIAAERGIASPALFESVAEHGGVRGNDAVPVDMQRRFPTAHDVDVKTHVRMQAAFQRHVHAAVSKTINLRKDATAADVKAAYELAYELGCKGITVYRDGSREGQVLVTGARGTVVNTAPSCPECGTVLVVQTHCRLCRHCGWSVCG